MQSSLHSELASNILPTPKKMDTISSSAGSQPMPSFSLFPKTLVPPRFNMPAAQNIEESNFDSPELKNFNNLEERSSSLTAHHDFYHDFQTGQLSSPCTLSPDRLSWTHEEQFISKQLGEMMVVEEIDDFEDEDEKDSEFKENQ